MEFRQLDLLLAVMECASVSKASERVNLSPGAISLQLHNLAAELHTELFVRSGKRLVPTPAAHRLAEQAKGVLHHVRIVEREFENDAATDARPFHFATGATTLIHRLGRPLRLLRKRFPSTSIQVTVSPTEEMVAGVLERRFDLALISLPFEDERLMLIPLYEEEMLILRPSTALVRGWHVGGMKSAEVGAASYVLYPKRSNMRRMIDGFFREIGVTPPVTMEADDTEAIKGLVASGFGSSILPEFALRGQPRFFRVYRVPEHRLVRRQALAMARSERPRALTQAVARFLKEELTGRATTPSNR
jgi:DNA-binding transcriptional LysR family regulator